MSFRCALASGCTDSGIAFRTLAFGHSFGPMAVMPSVVHPAALDAGLAANLMQCGPEPHGTIRCPAGDCEAIGREGPTASLGAASRPRRFRSSSSSRPVDRQGFARKPREGALRAFTEAVNQARHILVAPFVSANNHQHALAILVEAGAEIHPIRPAIHMVPRRQIAPRPALMIVPPLRLQPGDGADRQPGRVRPKQGRQGLGKVAGPCVGKTIPRIVF